MKKATQKQNTHEEKAISRRKEAKFDRIQRNPGRPAKPRYVTSIEQLKQLGEAEKAELKKVTDKFLFRASDYYLSLIDWTDPQDPIRRIIVPDPEELEEWGRLDPSDEHAYTVIPGLEHKYNSTALFLVSNVCEGVCRYCFRKRVFLNPRSACLQDLPAAVQYVREHSEITNVLLTGGDPLMLSTRKLEQIVKELRGIDHVKIIRIGTRLPAFNPYRIIEDPALPEMIERHTTKRKKIYVMTHFVHPRELTEPAVSAVNLLQKAGALLSNQTPLLRGINDDPQVLADLLANLCFIGATPYYIFQCRPALGNRAYTVPIEKGYEIVESAKSLVSGLGKRVRFVMSHSTGKIEIAGKTRSRVYFKYHRAADDADSGRFLVLRSNPKAYWLEDYTEVIRDYSINLPYRSYGPE